MKINRSNRLLLALLVTLAATSQSHADITANVIPGAPGPNQLTGGTLITGGILTDDINNVGNTNTATLGVTGASTTTGITNTGDISNTGNIISNTVGTNTLVVAGTTTTTGIQNNGNLVNTGTGLFNDTLTVQPAILTETTNTPTNTGQGASNPASAAFGAPTPGSTTILTVLGGVDATSTTSTGGGAIIDTNGNASFTSATGETVSGSYTRLTTVDVYNADQGALAGTPVPGTQRYYAAYEDPNNPGEYLPLAGPAGDLATLDAFVAATPITDAVFAPLGLTPVALDETGGNLLVEGDSQLDGDLNVDGATTTNGIDNAGDVETDTLTVNNGASVGSLAVTNGATVGGGLTVDGASTLSGVVNTNVIQNSGNVTTATLNVNGATTLSGLANTNGINNTGNISTGTLNVSGVTTLNGPLQVNSNATVTGNFAVNGNTTLGNSSTDVTTINGLLDAKNGINANNNRITNVGNPIALTDAVNKSYVDTADQKLQSQINSHDNQIKSNTRGIAMVAAMTNTTIQPGMKQAIDFNLAQFDDATGFAFGYGYRVNENLQINAAGASTTDFDEAVGRLGISYQW